jgi:hypothetical protein
VLTKWLLSAGAAAQGVTSVMSTCSSGAWNSEAVAIANAAGILAIVTLANIAEAAVSQFLRNGDAAVAATSCAANKGGATTSAELNTTVSLAAPIEPLLRALHTLFVEPV